MPHLRWSTVVALFFLFLLFLGFCGALHPAFDTLALYRPLVVVLLALLTVIHIIKGKTQRSIYLTIATVFGFGSIAAYSNLEALGHRPDFTVMQVNTNWDDGVTDEVLGRLEVLIPDVVALQTNSAADQNIGSALAALYPNSAVCGAPGGGSVAVYTRFEFVAGALPFCDDGQGFVAARLVTGMGAVTFVSMRTNAPDTVPDDPNASEAAHAARLGAFVEDNDGPFVIAGDFASAPWSHRVRQLANAAGAKVAPGIERTSGVMWGLLGVRMNHVLVPQSWNAETTVVSVPASTTDAVYADIYFDWISESRL